MREHADDGDYAQDRAIISKDEDMERDGESLKALPIGYDDFKELRDSGLYYVDKSALIDQILLSRAKVLLFTRPRRFGKSLNLSMLDAYLNSRYAGGPDRFSDLAVSALRPDDSEKNSNFIIKLNFKRLETETFEVFMESYRDIMGSLFEMFDELHNSDKLTPRLKEHYESVSRGKADYVLLASAVMYLCEMIDRHYGKKPIILIDEYDHPMNGTYGRDEIHERVKSFLRSVLGNALKSNEHLRFAVLTGVMRISKESIFSGLNNLKVNDVFSTDYDEMYGFTPSEVAEMCADYGHPERFEEAKEWYDGYRFGNADVYNPWSIVNYVKQGFVPKPYWAGTSGNSIISDLADRTDAETWRKLEALCSGGSIEAEISADVAYSDLQSSGDAIYSVMVASGYLNAKKIDSGAYDEMYDVSIPNTEMRYVFSKMIRDRLGSGTNAVLNRFVDSALSGDVEDMEKSLGTLMEDLSIRILKDEFPYEAFVTGLLASQGGRYEITADRESGNGFHDIRMKRIRGSGPSLVIEIKRRRIGDPSVEALASVALNQIDSKGYARGLEGDVILYGIAFDGKVPTIRMRRVRPSLRYRKFDSRIRSPNRAHISIDALET